MILLTVGSKFPLDVHSPGDYDNQPDERMMGEAEEMSEAEENVAFLLPWCCDELEWSLKEFAGISVDIFSDCAWPGDGCSGCFDWGGNEPAGNLAEVAAATGFSPGAFSGWDDVVGLAGRADDCRIHSTVGSLAGTRAALLCGSWNDSQWVAGEPGADDEGPDPWADDGDFERGNQH